MAGKAALNEALERWKARCMEVQSMTLVSADESSADRTARIAGLRRDYAAFVQYYFPHICTDSGTGSSIPCARFHIAAASGVHLTRVNVYDKNGEPSWKEYWTLR